MVAEVLIAIATAVLPIIIRHWFDSDDEDQPRQTSGVRAAGNAPDLNELRRRVRRRGQ